MITEMAGRDVRLAADTLDAPGGLHAPADYRRHVACVLLRRAVAEAFRQATGRRER
jgi:hypothetical protein